MNLKVKRIKELIDILNKASDEYYNNKPQSMTDKEWDKMFDELNNLENEVGIFFSNSPTQNAGYRVVDSLPKIKHSTPLLSLGKTKSIEDLKKFLGHKEGVLMHKMDGGTEIVDYTDEYLKYLATRGSSSTNEGQDITHNSSVILGLPNKLKHMKHIQVVGEGIMYKSKFEEINKPLPEDEKYANPRNLANASSSMLDSSRVSEREIRFIPFGTLECDIFETKIEELEFLNSNGFNVVEYVLVNKDNLEEEVLRMTSERESLDFDIDGLVLAHNDIEYGKSLGKTSHHFNNAIAYKFFNEEIETILKGVSVDVGKSGQVSYVAEFEPIEIYGTTVRRASLSNYSLIKGLELGIGDAITVTKANEIIPMVTDNLTRSNTYDKALKCPVCDSELIHKGVHQFCDNFGCERQVLGRLVHFCSRDAMDIRGMSEETIKAIMTINNALYLPSDLYKLKDIKSEMLKLDRFGKSKVNNILEAIENSKSRPLNNVLYALSIPQCGRTVSKKIAEAYHSMDELIENATWSGLTKLVGDSVGTSFYNNFLTKRNFIGMIRMLQNHGVEMIQPQEEKSNKLEGLSFCVTGKVYKFENRKALEGKIESLGGKKTSGVTSKTSFLICNEESNSGKCKKAKELGIKRITENEFIEMIK